MKFVGHICKMLLLSLAGFHSKQEKTLNQTSSGRSFRRPKQTPEERKSEKERAANDLQENWSMGEFPYMYGSQGKQNPPVIVVDGYNLLFRAIMLDSEYNGDEGIDSNKDKLERELQGFGMYMEVKIALAYDAMGYKGDNLSQSLHSKRNAHVLDVFYCFDCEADTGILLEVDRLVAEGAELVLVVTSDSSVRNAAFRPPTVFVKTSELFLQEMIRYRRESYQAVTEHNSVPTVGKLSTALSTGTLHDMSVLRNKLAKKEKRESKAKQVEHVKKEAVTPERNGVTPSTKQKQVGYLSFFQYLTTKSSVRQNSDNTGSNGIWGWDFLLTIPSVVKCRRGLTQAIPSSQWTNLWTQKLRAS